MPLTQEQKSYLDETIKIARSTEWQVDKETKAVLGRLIGAVQSLRLIVAAHEQKEAQEKAACQHMEFPRLRSDKAMMRLMGVETVEPFPLEREGPR